MGHSKHVLAGSACAAHAWLGKNKVWTIEHSNREMYLSEVTASLNFLLTQQNHLTGEPWDWLFHFLHQLEYNLL